MASGLSLIEFKSKVQRLRGFVDIKRFRALV